jgi:hypothetical protein
VDFGLAFKGGWVFITGVPITKRRRSRSRIYSYSMIRYRPAILAESQPALKVSFNRPRPSLSRYILL